MVTRHATLLAVVVAFTCTLLASTIGACTLLDEDPPTSTCKTSEDCFRAQGEFCNLETKRCELRMDAGVDAP